MSATTFLLAMWAAAMLSAQANPPADLPEMIAGARVDGRLVAWCRGQFQDRRAHGYAVAVSLAAGGGRYLAVDRAGVVGDLAPFKGAADLACYTPAEARKLDASIRSSETISGRIAPLFATTVVCGFVNETSAQCFQYSMKARAFVKVGEWQT